MFIVLEAHQTHHDGRLKKFAKGDHKYTPEKFEKEKAKSEKELAESKLEHARLITELTKIAL